MGLVLGLLCLTRAEGALIALLIVGIGLAVVELQAHRDVRCGQQRAGTQQFVMEGPNIESVAQRQLSSFADSHHPELANLIGQRLSRITDVTIDFIDDINLLLK